MQSQAVPSLENSKTENLLENFGQTSNEASNNVSVLPTSSNFNVCAQGRSSSNICWGDRKVTLPPPQTASCLSNLFNFYINRKSLLNTSETGVLNGSKNFSYVHKSLLHFNDMTSRFSNKRMFSCPHCRYLTDRKNNLKRHVITMHRKCDRQLECCGLLFNNKAALRDHVVVFHNAGYSCKHCDRNFCRKALLKRHLTVHSGKKDFACHLCDYASSHKSNLDRHKKVHVRQTSPMNYISDDADKIKRSSKNESDGLKKNFDAKVNNEQCENNDEQDVTSSNLTFDSFNLDKKGTSKFKSNVKSDLEEKKHGEIQCSNESDNFSSSLTTPESSQSPPLLSSSSSTSSPSPVLMQFNDPPNIGNPDLNFKCSNLENNLFGLQNLKKEIIERVPGVLGRTSHHDCCRSLNSHLFTNYNCTQHMDSFFAFSNDHPTNKLTYRKIYNFCTMPCSFNQSFVNHNHNYLTTEQHFQNDYKQFEYYNQFKKFQFCKFSRQTSPHTSNNLVECSEESSYPEDSQRSQKAKPFPQRFSVKYNEKQSTQTLTGAEINDYKKSMCFSNSELIGTASNIKQIVNVATNNECNVNDKTKLAPGKSEPKLFRLVDVISPNWKNNNAS